VSDITSFLSTGLNQIGLAAAATPRFAAEGLVAALRRLPRLPPEGQSGPRGLNRPGSGPAQPQTSLPAIS